MSGQLWELSIFTAWFVLGIFSNYVWRERDQAMKKQLIEAEGIQKHGSYKFANFLFKEFSRTF